jgi:hypothetical protein
VTLSLMPDSIALVIDTEFSAAGFGQSAGVHIPRERLDELINALKCADSKEKIKAMIPPEWKTAQTRLGLEIAAPYQVDLGGMKVEAALLVRNFGGRSGTLVFRHYGVVKPYIEELRKLGFGFSVLEQPRKGYETEDTMAMLSEWDWTGDAATKPDWIVELNDESD